MCYSRVAVYGRWLWVDGWEREGSRVEGRIKMRFSRLVEFNVTPALPPPDTHTSLAHIVCRLTARQHTLPSRIAEDNVDNDNKRGPVASADKTSVVGH